ncbi:hypothetical protein FQN57_001593 [Myotisia sp. PD_48]|nr:hypothetical protein FQN57_001593 [Myotisia sp. PD_48]
MAKAGRTIRLVNLGLRLVQACASVIILGIFAYFLAVLADHDLGIETWVKATTGIAGAATLYTLLAASFTLAIGGIPFFSWLAILLDFGFAASFIAIAILTRKGTESCSGHVSTPLGSGDAKDPARGFGETGFGTGDGKNLTYMPDLMSACRLQKAVFAISIIGIFLFLSSIPAQRSYTKQRNDIKRPGSQHSGTGTGAGRLQKLRRFWPFPRPPPPGPRATGINYYDSNTSTGTIPLAERQAEDKASRYKNPFDHTDSGSDKGVKRTYAATAAAPVQGSRKPVSSTPYGAGSDPGYGNSAYISPGTAPAPQPTSHATYNSGRNTAEPGDYAHGYGGTPYSTT